MMASSVLYNDDELNEQTWLYYVDEKTKHLKLNIEEWLASGINEHSERHDVLCKNAEHLKNDSVTRKKENIPNTFQPLMKISNPKGTQGVEKVKVKSDTSHFKMKPRIGGTVGLQQCWNFEMDGLDMNRTLLEDVKLSFDNSLEYYNSNNCNGKKENDEPLGCSPILAEKEVLFIPQNVSTPEFQIQRHTKTKKGHFQKINDHSRELQKKLSLERLNDQLNEEKCQMLNDTFIVFEDDSNEGKKGSESQSREEQSHCSAFVDNELNATDKPEKVSPETGILRFGKTKTVHPLKPIHRPRELNRKQSLERLSDHTNEEQSRDLNATFSKSGSGDVFDKEDLQRVENAVNKLKLDKEEPTDDLPLLNSPLGNRENHSRGSETHIHDLNETFIQEFPDHNRASKGQRVFENNGKFALTSALRDKQGSCPNLGVLNTHEDYNKMTHNAFRLKAVTTGNVIDIETVSAGSSASIVQKKIPKKLGSRLPMPVNRGALPRTSRIPLPNRDQIK